MKHMKQAMAATLAALLLLGASVDVDRRATAQPCPVELVTSRPFPVAQPDAVGVTTSPREALLLVDKTTGETLFEQDADSPRIVASTIKILTALTVLRHVGTDDFVQVSANATATFGAMLGIRQGQSYTVSFLLAGLLGRSGNDAAIALAEHVAGTQEAFVGLMRDEAARLGLTGAIINDVTGLADSNRLTARQLGVLSAEALRNELLAPYLSAPTVTLPNGSQAPNRNLLLERYPGATGVKTGFTTRAGHALVASADRGGRTLIAVVLSAGTDSARFGRATQLLDFGFERTAVYPLATQLTWENQGGLSLWEIPTTTVLSGTEPVSLRWALPRTPTDAVNVELIVSQQPICHFRTVPAVVDDEVAESVGVLIRAFVAHGYGAAFFSESSGSLRVPVQGGRS